MQKALFTGELLIDGLKLSCAVLEDETRVLSERAMSKALGATRSGAHWRRKKANDEDGVATLPAYLSAKNLSGFIDNDLRNKLLDPIQYDVGNGTIASGIEASLIPRICEVFLKARDSNALVQIQEHFAIKADMLIRAFAKVGITALIDEATGYQDKRNRDALSKLLAIYLSEEKLRWAKFFPDEFYKLIYKLRGWEWPPLSTSKRPSIIGKYTNDIVYNRLPDGVLEKLKEKNPVMQNTHRRKYKHTQFLSPDLGQPDLKAHIASVIALMKISKSWSQFMRHLNVAFPVGRTIPLTLEGVYDE